MNSKKFFLSWLAVYIVIFIFDMIFHGKILGHLYEQTAELWRPKDQMNQFMPWLTGGTILWSGVFSYLFLTGYKDRGLSAGIRYGALIGLLFAAHNAVMYAVQPLPLVLVNSWTIGNIAEYGLGGAVLGLVNKSS